MNGFDAFTLLVSLHFDFNDKVARVGTEILGKLDPIACGQLVDRYPQGLVLDRENFEAMRLEGNIDLVATMMLSNDRWKMWERQNSIFALTSAANC